MNPIEILLNAKEAVIAFPEACASLFVGGVVLGWTASFFFSHRDLKVNRLIIDEIRRTNSISQTMKNELLQHTLPQGTLLRLLKSVDSLFYYRYCYRSNVLPYTKVTDMAYHRETK
jgi:hypothetical protein